jgi:hypothetical protein
MQIDVDINMPQLESLFRNECSFKVLTHRTKIKFKLLQSVLLRFKKPVKHQNLRGRLLPLLFVDFFYNLLGIL